MDINPFEKITVSDLESPVMLKHVKGATANMKSRHAYGVSFCLSGKITYTHNGLKYISDPNHAVFHPQGESYFMHCDESGEFLVINFFCTESFRPKSFHTIELSNLTPYINDCDVLQHIQTIKRSDSRINSLSVFYSMLSRLATESQKERINPFLVTALTHLENRIDDPNLDVTELAEISGISEVYLRKLFNSTFNISPKQYLTDLRMSKAKQLLKSSNTPITQIAENCGYMSIYHFSRAFKTAVGYTPTEYRNKHSQFVL